ncbi:MAG: hypothetical protein QM708_01140 [Propioniciclava sp.]|uniref:hypothetical protein n=1 Tax=Propioniciclava sp. TaxID=2038686 RepID=UPI0039E46BFC
MTALMLEGTSRSGVRSRAAQGLRPSSGAPRRDSQRTPLGPTGEHPPVVHWAHVKPRACADVAPAPVHAEVACAAVSDERAVGVEAVAAPAVVAAPTRLVWTPRGVAVMVSVVMITALFMFGTIVGAFFAVSNEPLTTPAAPAVALSGASSSIAGERS